MGSHQTGGFQSDHTAGRHAFVRVFRNTGAVAADVAQDGRFTANIEGHLGSIQRAILLQRRILQIIAAQEFAGHKVSRCRHHRIRGARHVKCRTVSNYDASLRIESPSTCIQKWRAHGRAARLHLVVRRLLGSQTHLRTRCLDLGTATVRVAALQINASPAHLNARSIESVTG